MELEDFKKVIIEKGKEINIELDDDKSVMFY